MLTWPTTLPQYLLTRSYKETAPDVVIRTKMDAGPAKVRRRFTAGVRQVEGLLVLAQDQVAMLDNFFLNDCQGGAVSFIWTYQREAQDTDALLDTDITTDTDIRLPLSWPPATVRFVKPPQYHDTGDGMHYEVSLSLEILP